MFFFVLAVALVLGLVGSVFATEKDDSAKITSVKIEGNKAISNLLIYGHLIEKEGDPFSLRRVRMDIHNLFSMGDFTDVKADIEPGAKAGQVNLTFKVVERPVINKMIFKGNKKWKASKFLEEIKLAPKSAFDQTQLNSDLETIKKLYSDEGYSNAVISAETKVNAEKNTVDVIVEVSEGFQIKISDITVLNAQAFSVNKITDQMKENKKGDKYKPESLKDDLKKIEDFYHDEGYLKAVVLNHSEKISPEKKKVSIAISIQEGDQYNTGEVKYHGNVLMDDDELNKALGLKKGTLLRKNEMDDGTRKMKTLYADKGYIYSSINPTMQYDDELKKVDISFEISEGQVAYVQDVKIVGNYKTQDYVIRRELAISAGDKFEASKIRLSAQNLYNLGFFDEINPEVEPGDAPGKEVLIFRVKERHTGSISVGGGYSSVDGFVGNVKLEEANLFGKGQHANLDVQFGASTTSFNIGFSEPWLFNTRTSLGVNLFDTQRYFYSNGVVTTTDQIYEESQIGASISVGRRLSQYWSVFGAYSLQDVVINNIGQAYSTIGTPNYIAPQDGWTSSFTPRLVYDSRDKFDFPTMGWKHQLSIEFAGGPLQGSNNFIKLIEDTSHFIPLPLGFVFGEHIRLGGAQGYWFNGHGFTDVPIYEKFYAGGTDTVRGYTERSVGPITGGNALFVSNTEFRHDIIGPLRALGFFDIGDSWSNIYSLNEYNLGINEAGPQMGAGIGARLTIPGTLIAIRLDYGWPINTNLSTAAAPRGGTLHFNLGDLF